MDAAMAMAHKWRKQAERDKSTERVNVMRRR